MKIRISTSLITISMNFCFHTKHKEPVYAGTGGTNRAWSPLGSEAALREAASLPLSRWRAPAIIAWLELALGMPQYAATIADNVKSGKVRNCIIHFIFKLFITSYSYLIIFLKHDRNKHQAIPVSLTSFFSSKKGFFYFDFHPEER